MSNLPPFLVPRKKCTAIWQTITPASQELDHEVGRILQAVRDRGWENDTIVIFSSDQGLAVGGRHGLMGKQNLYEHVKPPLILAGPGIPHGQSNALVYLYDLFPTLCELAGVDVPAVAKGQSLLPITRGERQSLRPLPHGSLSRLPTHDTRRTLEIAGLQRSRRTHWQLFDLANDPDELHDVSSQAQFAGQRQRLKKLLAEARRQFDDPVDFDATVVPNNTRSRAVSHPIGSTWVLPAATAGAANWPRRQIRNEATIELNRRAGLRGSAPQSRRPGPTL